MDAVEPPTDPEVAAEPNTRNANAATVKIAPQSSPASTSPQAPEDTARSVPVHKWAEMTDSLDDRATEDFSAGTHNLTARCGQTPGVFQTGRTRQMPVDPSTQRQL